MLIVWPMPEEIKAPPNAAEARKKRLRSNDDMSSLRLITCHAVIRGGDPFGRRFNAAAERPVSAVGNAYPKTAGFVSYFPLGEGQMESAI